MKKRILLLSAYDASSHRQWRYRLAELFPEFDWTQLALPPRNFSWRIRGNSLHWAFSHAEVLQQQYDLLIATSMVDLSSLRGFIPALSQIPNLVYFHENQFVYPPRPSSPSETADSLRSKFKEQINVEPQLVPLYTALCADSLIFNSHYNRNTFLQGSRSLLQKLPDQFPDSLMQRLENSRVIPVPLPARDRFTLQPASSEPDAASTLKIIWNHRWEYDKGPQLLLELVKLISQQRLPFQINIAGEQFRQQPPQFAEIKRILDTHTVDAEAAQFGYIEEQDQYFELLSRCDVVLSTALHDFQGLALQEACIAGCTPLAPNDLVYPEYLDPQFLYSVQGSECENAQCILAKLQQWHRLKLAGAQIPKIGLDDYATEPTRSKYSALFSSALGTD